MPILSLATGVDTESSLGRKQAHHAIRVQEDGRHETDQTDWFISRRTALFGEVGLLFGKFDRIAIDGDDYDLADDIGVSSGRVLFGIRFRL